MVGSLRCLLNLWMNIPYENNPEENSPEYNMRFSKGAQKKIDVDINGPN